MKPSPHLRLVRLSILGGAGAGFLALACRDTGGASRAPIDPREEIARCEEARTDDGGALESLVSGGSEPVRERAATALGRLPFPEAGEQITNSLCAATKDASSNVRVAAVFALGMRADPAAADALLAARSDPDERVRAHAVEAASRTDEPRLHRFVLEALRDTTEAVREEAAVGPSRWKRDAPDADEVDAALAAAASAELNGDVGWRSLFALARRHSAKAGAAFESALSSSDVRARIFGAQGSRFTPFDSSGNDKLRAALADADWRVVCEAALALGEHPVPQSLPDLAKALAHSSSHVRRCAAEALAHFADEKDAVRPILAKAIEDPSIDVRCAVLVARAQLDGDALTGEVTKVAGSRNPLLRAGAAGAAASLTETAAIPLLLRLSRDADPHVVDIAAHALKGHPTLEVRTRLREMLADKDNGVRLAAADVLKEIGGAEDLPGLAACLESSRGDISGEIASTIVDAAARIGGERAREILERGSFHANEFVRRKSRDLLSKQSPETKVEGPSSTGAGESGPSRSAKVLVPNVDYPASGPNPRVEIVTNRGSMVFELLRDETPVHVFNFLELARRGFYDGTTFHRIVPDFVIQGGDPRGDGNGGKTWSGESLRGEFTPRKFLRGSLGMPRNDDPDSGGSQIFVTHRETPHLDGRYTLFGELREGFDVLDKIELGDVIRSVRILGDTRSR
jgi:cyclophilin family peptidyl-prolyl cis-trans isomerase/HEAT repeat protein